MEAVAYTLKITWISGKINGWMGSESLWSSGWGASEVSGLIPTGGSSFFIHLLWYCSKEQFALFSIALLYFFMALSLH